MSQMVQHGQTQAAAVPLPEPKFILPPGAVVMIGEEEYQVERRLPDGRCQLLSVAEGIPLFQTDRQLADRQLRGEFYVAAERGLRIFAPPPLSPIAIGDKAHEKNLRKHAYVQHCLDEVYPLVLSRQRLVPVIEGCAAARGEEAPAFTTVLSWLKEWQRYGEVYGTAAYSDRHDLKGRFGGRMLDHQERAIEYGIDQWLKLGKKVLAYDLVVDHVRKFDEERGPLLDKASLGPVYVDSKGRLIPPSKRTFERRCALLDPMVRDWAMKGPAFARKHHRTYQTRALPDRPYQEVEVDDCTLDILVIDPSGLVLGRPNLIVFRDRATGMILGYSLSFEGPSYASFVQGLKHAMYPKSLEAYPQVKNAWPCWGRIENLFLDNALHFLGDNIRAAARELGFNLVHCAPRQPWLKGAVERIFETAGTGFIHSLPGTTLQNVIARRDHENLGEATLTLDELGQLLTLWICDIYHARVQKGLGPIRGVGDVPLQVWADKAKDYRTPLLPHEDVFMSLAGDVEERTIQKDGISWDYIKYESADLWALLRHPEHKRGRGATKYKVVRNPYDLGQISVIDPYNSRVLNIPATEGHHAYASGLTLHQHQVIIANARQRAGERTDFRALEEARARLAKIVVALCSNPSRRKVEGTVARYLRSEVSRRQRSQIVSGDAAEAPGALLDFRPQPGLSVPAHTAPPATPLEPAPAASLISSDNDDDLQQLRQSSTIRSYRD